MHSLSSTFLRMKIKISILLILLLNSFNYATGQVIQVNIKHSKLTATYSFVQKLSTYYPDNEYKQIFNNSKYNAAPYLDLIAQLDTLNLYESLPFQQYPYGQKQPFQTISLIEKNLINAKALDEFIRQTFGIIPNDHFFAFVNIISKFELIYEELIYLPNKESFDNKVDELAQFVKTVNLNQYFEVGLNFYGTKWNSSIPIDIAIIPTLGNGGFTATAFLNNAVSEVPLGFKHNDVLFCVLMHEIFHLLYDGQSLELKKNIEKWFDQSTSINSQYAYLLLDEALATALANGYIYEKFNKETDKEEWYNIKYINFMSQKIYPMVKDYIENKKTIDKKFVEQFIKIYDDNFSDWTKELDHILTYRYVLSDNQDDFRYLRKKYRYASKSAYQTPINQNNLEALKLAPLTKVLVVSENHNEKLQLIKNAFTALKNWSFKAESEFVYTTILADKTRLIIVNNTNDNLEELLDHSFNNKRIE